MSLPTRIVLTPGEPAGIGPDITLALLQADWPAEIIVIADPDVMAERATLLKIDAHFQQVNLNAPPTPHRAGNITCLPVAARNPVQPGVLNVNNAQYVLACLDLAVDLCLAQQVHALVTGPVQKNIITEAGIAFTGHTGYLRQRCQSSAPAIMFFVVDDLKVALLTTHIPLAEVSSSITEALVHTFIHSLHQELHDKFGLSQPRILLCGINPHAGEAGQLGREEKTVLIPAAQRLRAEGINITDPLPADTIFTHYRGATDVIVAMFHDQLLPVIKYVGFDRAVNITLGLPIIRTSVDHGTALSLAGTGQASSKSLSAAVCMALTLGKAI